MNSFRLSVTSGDNVHTRVYFAERDAETVVALLHNSSLRFLSNLLTEHLNFVISAMASGTVFEQKLYDRQVKTMFDCLSHCMVPELQELRYNLRSARVADEEKEAPHNVYYTAHIDALYKLSKLLPVVIEACTGHVPLTLRYETV